MTLVTILPTGPLRECCSGHRVVGASQRLRGRVCGRTGYDRSRIPAKPRRCGGDPDLGIHCIQISAALCRRTAEETAFRHRQLKSRTGRVSRQHRREANSVGGSRQTGILAVHAHYVDLGCRRAGAPATPPAMLWTDRRCTFPTVGCSR